MAKVLTGVVMTATFGAGCWQSYRLQWKKGIVGDREAKTSEIRSLEGKRLPLDLPAFTRVSVTGRFLHPLSAFVFPRPAPIAVNTSPTSSRILGAAILTPFVVYTREALQRRKEFLAYQGKSWVGRLWVQLKTRGNPPKRPAEVEAEVSARNTAAAATQVVLVHQGWIPEKDYNQFKETGRWPKYLPFTDDDLALSTIQAIAQPKDTLPTTSSGGQVSSRRRYAHARSFPHLLPEDILASLQEEQQRSARGGSTSSSTSSSSSSSLQRSTLVGQFYLEKIDPEYFPVGTLPPAKKNDFPIPRSRIDVLQVGYCTPEKHLEYACFWFGSCLTIGAFYTLVRRGQVRRLRSLRRA